MGVFAELQAEAAGLAKRLGGRSIAWVWDCDGWTAAAPNADRRWRCGVVDEPFFGSGNTGEEALRSLIEAMRRQLNGSDSL